MCSSCAGDYENPDMTAPEETRPQCPVCKRVRGVRFRQRDGKYVCALCGHTWAKTEETVRDA